ncbi:MAG: phospho-N-acetylmuramoyl-pentapeptide-transferase [Ruminococcus sp.]|nr:phospho-N-acetylmuramoyl-pentapeptide-transferase [Ruminococcus sp.]
MLKNLIPSAYESIYYGLFILCGFFIPFLSIRVFKNILPRDKGRDFALNGKLSEGKPRGAGLLMFTSFVITVALFVPLTTELIIYIAFIYLEMLSGYLDDSAAIPWGRVKKGLIDLVVSVGISATYCVYNEPTVKLALVGVSFTLPTVVYIVLGAALVWGSINVTNCSDGVDGLCGSLSIISLATVFILMQNMINLGEEADDFRLIILSAILMLIAYLWYNTSPSVMLMGDAGSRALGVLIALSAMKLGSPLLFLIFAFMLIIDGGLSLLKISCIKFLKMKNFMKNIRTPIHDHMRKNNSWSDTQVVTRFSIVQGVISLALIGFLTR